MSASERAIATIQPHPGIGHNRPGRCPTCGAKKRSNEEHRLFFAVVAAAFANWPHAHQFQPDDAEHLRAWLLIGANHCDTFEAPDIVGSDLNSIVALGKFFCRGKRHFRLKQTDTGIVILRPKSIDKESCPTPEFRTVSTAVYEIIQGITGITPEAYKAELGKEA